ncbi:hypothetical protein EVB27_013 [Rhizobium phage RHph_TM16]|nr:hypothetical protein EVB27_013 [Rhizobium phage RHph_TM16]
MGLFLFLAHWPRLTLPARQSSTHLFSNDNKAKPYNNGRVDSLYSARTSGKQSWSPSWKCFSLCWQEPLVDFYGRSTIGPTGESSSLTWSPVHSLPDTWGQKALNFFTGSSGMSLMLTPSRASWNSQGSSLAQAGSLSLGGFTT